LTPKHENVQLKHLFLKHAWLENPAFKMLAGFFKPWFQLALGACIVNNHQG
jgi:hypothetical protein